MVHVNAAGAQLTVTVWTACPTGSLLLSGVFHDPSLVSRNLVGSIQRHVLEAMLEGQMGDGEVGAHALGYRALCGICDV